MGSDAGDLSDILAEHTRRRPLWTRVLLLVGGGLSILLGVVLSPLPIIPASIPFYILGFALLAAASNRARRAINWAERKLPRRLRVWIREHAAKSRARKQAREQAAAERGKPGR